LQAMDVAGSDQEALHHTFTKTDVSTAGALGTRYDYSTSVSPPHSPARCAPEAANRVLTVPPLQLSMDLTTRSCWPPPPPPPRFLSSR
jgi:hypothetical protein